MRSTWCPPSWMSSVSNRRRRSRDSRQSHFDGMSMRYSFDDPAAPGTRQPSSSPCSGREDLARRMEGRHQASDPQRLVQLQRRRMGAYHTDVDRSELHNLAAEHPEKVREMVNLWYAEAGANRRLSPRRPVRPRDLSRGTATTQRPTNRYVYFPNHAEVPEAQAVIVRGRSFTIGAVVDLPSPVHRVSSSPRAPDSAGTACT